MSESLIKKISKNPGQADEEKNPRRVCLQGDGRDRWQVRVVGAGSRWPLRNNPSLTLSLTLFSDSSVSCLPWKLSLLLSWRTVLFLPWGRLVVILDFLIPALLSVSSLQSRPPCWLASMLCLSRYLVLGRICCNPQDLV